MKVVDASVVVELVAGRLDPARLGEEELAAPHLIDSEVTNALRNLVLRGHLTDRQGGRAFAGFLQLGLERWPADWLRPRIWALRHSMTSYDATYVALAERLEATALLTSDVRQAQAPGVQCPVQLL